MTQSFTPLDSLLLTIVLATLAVGLPIFLVLAIRFLWERSLAVGRSRELEKLTWQLHRIASALEHQMNLSFPAVQPGTEQPSDLAYLRQPVGQQAAGVQSVAAPVASAPIPTRQESTTIQAAATEQVDSSTFPPLETPQPGQVPKHGGVNSMFGF